LRNFWALAISKIIWSLEKVIFYPKLEQVYKELNLSSATGRLVVFDVGANKGQSIDFFMGIYLDPKIYAFEPSKKTFAKLNSKLKESLQKDVSLFQMGLGTFPGEINFHESILDENSTFVLPNKNSRYQKKKNMALFQKSNNAFITTSVQITTLDDFIQVNEINQIDILKIDVEGFEYEVLLGANIALQEKRIKVVQFERHQNDMHKDNFPAINEFLKMHGFFRISEIKHPFGSFFEELYMRS
jgi:FkbM family methyltransferase